MEFDQKKHLLIIDDNKTNLEIISSILDRYVIQTSTCGKQAIEFLENELVDLILLDIVMPKMDGFEICKRIKSNERTKNIPVVFITAKHDIENLKKAFECGAVDYVTKPFNALELMARVNTHLELRSYQNELESRVKDEISKNQLKERMLYQSSKQASLGELLMHIAHQWKQPLSEIGSINVLNIGKLQSTKATTKEELIYSFNKIDQILKFMSNTIDTFQDFYTPSDKSHYIEVSKIINDTKNIIDATYNYHNIKLLINQNTNPKVYVNQNELSQAILNLLNNSKDAILSRGVKNPIVQINISTLNQRCLIEISDNAGGVDDKMLKELFLPFKSTKNGSGIGLYMSKAIINKNNGEISYLSDNNSFRILL